jgi:hypothetical protein
MEMEAAMEYKTADFNLAAYLLATDRPLHQVERSGGRAVFVFTGVAADEVQRYFQGAQVEARKLLNASRDLKTLLARDREEGGR